MWGHSPIHVTLHLRLTASGTCFETTNSFASRGSGRLCPFMWTDTVHGVCASSASVLSVFRALIKEPARNHSGPETDSSGSQTAHLLYQSAGETSGTGM